MRSNISSWSHVDCGVGVVGLVQPIQSNPQLNFTRSGDDTDTPNQFNIQFEVVNFTNTTKYICLILYLKVISNYIYTHTVYTSLSTTIIHRTQHYKYTYTIIYHIYTHRQYLFSSLYTNNNNNNNNNNFIVHIDITHNSINLYFLKYSSKLLVVV